MLYLNIWLTVKDSADISRLTELLAEAGRLSRQEPGCHRWEAYQSGSDETMFLLHERWESEAALDAHRLGEAYTTIYQPQILPLVSRDAHRCTLIE